MKKSRLRNARGRLRTDFDAKLLTARIRRAAPKAKRPCPHRRQAFNGERLPCADPRCDHGIGGDRTLVVAIMPKAEPSFAAWTADDAATSIHVEKVYFRRERWREELDAYPYFRDFFQWSEPARS